MRLLLCIIPIAVAACASDDPIYGEPEGSIAHCRDILEPADRKACVAQAQAGAARTPRARDIGPPDCHPASTNPKDRDAC